MALPPEVISAVETILGDVGDRYLAVMARSNGAAQVLPVTQQQWDDLVNAHESLGSHVPMATRFRRGPDGRWTQDGGWDIRPREDTGRLET